MLLQLLLQLIHINRIAGNTLYNLSINFSAERCYLDSQSSVIHIGHLVVIRNRQRILMGLSICLQLVFMNMVIRIMLKAQNIAQLDYFMFEFHTQDWVELQKTYYDNNLLRLVARIRLLS